MAEKEERILVLKATEDDFIYKHFNGKGFIPRQEAVEKMAIAIFEKDNVLAFDMRFDELAESKRAFYRSVAKAALNALLEGK